MGTPNPNPEILEGTLDVLAPKPSSAFPQRARSFPRAGRSGSASASPRRRWESGPREALHAELAHESIISRNTVLLAPGRGQRRKYPRYHDTQDTRKMHWTLTLIRFNLDVYLSPAGAGSIRKEELSLVDRETLDIVLRRGFGYYAGNGSERAYSAAGSH
jgi:hypothetical protein